MLSFGIEASRAFWTAVASERVCLGVAAPVAGGDGDRARQLGEQLATLGVGRALLVLNRRPLRMSGHTWHSMNVEVATDSHRDGPARAIGGKRRLRRDAAGGALALDRDPAELDLHRLQGLAHAVSQQGPYLVVAVGIVVSVARRRLADRASQPSLHPDHRHQPPRPDASDLAEEHA